MTEQQLLDLKDKVEDAKSNVSELKGQLTALMKQLNDDWQCKSIKEAETKLSGMEKNIKTLELKIQEATEELEDKYEIEE